jgi:hypothetical protein
VERRFGFGFVDIGGLLTFGYNATQFYDGMFKTPPYPSTWMAGMIASGTGTFDPTQNTVKFLVSVMNGAANVLWDSHAFRSYMWSWLQANPNTFVLGAPSSVASTVLTIQVS